MQTFEIRSATADDRTAVIHTLVVAFAADPMARWAFRQPQEFLQLFPAYIDAYSPAYGCDGAMCSRGYEGAALWLAPGVTPDESAFEALMTRMLENRDMSPMMRVMEQMERFHPHQPHWYLPLLGVDPRCQGNGCGTALLQPILNRCDREGTLAYLESSSPRNINLYQRHGFEAIGKIQSDDSPTLIPMVRQPRNA